MKIRSFFIDTEHSRLYEIQIDRIEYDKILQNIAISQ